MVADLTLLNSVCLQRTTSAGFRGIRIPMASVSDLLCTCNGQRQFWPSIHTQRPYQKTWMRTRSFSLRSLLLDYLPRHVTRWVAAEVLILLQRCWGSLLGITTIWGHRLLEDDGKTKREPFTYPPMGSLFRWSGSGSLACNIYPAILA